MRKKYFSKTTMSKSPIADSSSNVITFPSRTQKAYGSNRLTKFKSETWAS